MPTELLAGTMRFTSQTKPGPNMAFAVAMKVVRRESREEKEALISLVRGSGMGTGVGDWGG